MPPQAWVGCWVLQPQEGLQAGHVPPWLWPGALAAWEE